MREKYTHKGLSMLKLIKYLKGYRPQALIAPLFKFVEALFELIIPLIVARIIDVGIAGGDKDYVIKAGLVMVGLGAAGLMFSANTLPPYRPRDTAPISAETCSDI